MPTEGEPAPTNENASDLSHSKHSDKSEGREGREGRGELKLAGTRSIYFRLTKVFQLLQVYFV